MDKLPLDISLSIEDVNKRLDFLEKIINQYDIALKDEIMQLTYDLSELGKQEIIPIEIVNRVNELHDQILVDVSKQYLDTKNNCRALQDEISVYYSKLQPELPMSYAPPFIFDLDQVIDIFYHYEYLSDYKKDLQLYEVLIDLRKQHLNIKPSIKNKTVSSVASNLH